MIKENGNVVTGTEVSDDQCLFFHWEKDCKDFKEPGKCEGRNCQEKHRRQILFG